MIWDLEQVKAICCAGGLQHCSSSTWESASLILRQRDSVVRKVPRFKSQASLTLEAPLARHWIPRSVDPLRMEPLLQKLLLSELWLSEIKMCLFGLIWNSAAIWTIHQTPDVMLACKRLSGDHLIYPHIMSNGLEKLFIFNGESYIRASRHISSGEFVLVRHMVRSVQDQSRSALQASCWNVKWLHWWRVFQLKVKVSNFERPYIDHWSN